MRFIPCCAALLVALLPSGCVGKATSFLHEGHRTKYSIEDHELKTLIFHTSRDIMLHEMGSREPPKTIIVRARTHGTVLTSGPDWMVVSFDEDTGFSLPFLAGETDSGDLYWLATQNPGSADLRRVDRRAEPPVLHHDGKSYEIIEGADAHARVYHNDIEDLIDERPAPEGRKPD